MGSKILRRRTRDSFNLWAQNLRQWVFSFLLRFQAGCTFRKLIAPKLLEIDLKGLRIEISALNVDFNRASFDHLERH